MKSKPFKTNGAGLHPKWRGILKSGDSDNLHTSESDKDDSAETKLKNGMKETSKRRKLPIRGRKRKRHTSKGSRGDSNPLKTYSAGEYLNIPTARQREILSPIIPAHGVSMISGEKGVGKTFIAMSLGMAIASGRDIFGWKCAASHDVLFMDPELTTGTGQTRLRMVASSQGLISMPDHMTMWSAAAQYPAPPPNFADPEQIDALVHQCGKYDLVIVDSLSAMLRGVDLNSAQAYETIEDFSLRMRHNGTAVLLVQHLGKDASKGPRGTSKQEDLLDVSLSLRKSTKQCGLTGVSITCRKMRHHANSDFVPIEISYGDNNGQFQMDYRPLVAAKTEQIISRYRELELNGQVRRGALTEISRELGVSASQVTKAIQKYKRSVRDV